MSVVETRTDIPNLCKRIICQSHHSLPLYAGFVIVGDPNDASFLAHHCKASDQASLRTAAARAVDDVIKVNVKRLALLDDFCCAGHVTHAAEPVLGSTSWYQVRKMAAAPEVFAKFD